MLILNQNKKAILNTDNFSYLHIDEYLANGIKTFKLCCSGENLPAILGEYRTLEKAQNVLKGILLSSRNGIYEMPEGE